MTKPHWQGGSGGKGSAARSMEITQEQYANNWDAIFGKKGKTNEQRTRCMDGKLDSGEETGTEGSVPEPDDYPHDRVPTDSNH